MADPTPPDAPALDAPDDTPVDAPTATDSAAMAEALKKANAEAKKYRLEVKDRDAKLEQLAQQSMTDTEKAIATARAEARTEALREGGTRLVDAEVRAAAAGRNVDIAALLEGLDRSRFLDDDGDPKTEAIQRWVDRIAPPAEGVPLRVPAGVRETTAAPSGPAADFANFIHGQLQR